METALEAGWTLSDWVTWVSLRMGAKLSQHQIQMYVEEIQTWNLTEPELMALERLVRRSCDKFPGPATLRTMSNVIRFAKAETEPIFVIGKDSEGRTWARPTQLRRSVTPDPHTLERWKAEAASPEEAREAWNHAFYMKGLDPNGKNEKAEPDTPRPLNTTEMIRIVLGKKEYADYDDSPEALKDAGIEVKEKPEDDW